VGQARAARVWEPVGLIDRSHDEHINHLELFKGVET
jgi:hypothetical protein